MARQLNHLPTRSLRAGMRAPARTRHGATALAAALAALFTGCAGTPEDAAQAARLRSQAQAIFGVVQPVQAAEVRAPRAVLGRALFWDARLSLDGKTACASCHPREDWSSDRRRQSINAKGQPTSLHSQPVFMAQDQPSLRWYGDRRHGAHQAERSITGSMGYTKAEDVVPQLKSFGYEAPFRAAFPEQSEPVSPTHYAQALEAYQRTLRTPAPFDAFLQGSNSALSRQQLLGLEKFMAHGCAACHNGALLGGASFQKFGLVKDYWVATGSTPIDAGRFNATQQEADRHVFRVQMLRNVAKTAPYFHDGSVAKLEDAVRVMADVQLGRQLPDGDASDIVAFLRSLTGAIPEHYAPPW